MILLPLFLSFFVSQGTTANVSLELHLYEVEQDPHLVCNDGSPAGYYLRPATTSSGENLWIFYLEGGGWCWNETQCLVRFLYNGE